MQQMELLKLFLESLKNEVFLVIDKNKPYAIYFAWKDEYVNHIFTSGTCKKSFIRYGMNKLDSAITSKEDYLINVLIIIAKKSFNNANRKN